jgi:hypothetical protein
MAKLKGIQDEGRAKWPPHSPKYNAAISFIANIQHLVKQEPNLWFFMEEAERKFLEIAISTVYGKKVAPNDDDLNKLSLLYTKLKGAYDESRR